MKKFPLNMNKSENETNIKCRNENVASINVLILYLIFSFEIFNLYIYFWILVKNILILMLNQK